MIKIDFHMHTVATASDAHFEFDIETLKKYVTNAGMDAIAVTNHNMFDLNQYREITASIETTVFPGIEINLEGGHLLLVSDTNELDDFASRCSEITNKVPTPDASISIEELKQVFSDLGKYILIPHYDKKPPVPTSSIQQLRSFITAGEVNSPKKFMYCLKDNDRLVPVYFSDSRMSKNLSTIPVRQTYLACDDTSFSAIKSCLNDKRKVSLSADESIRLFRIFDNGQMLSTGLNVVLGERSSGKSYTLDQINAEQSHFGEVKYIRQFSLVERNSEEDKRKFDELLRQKHSLLSRDYLAELKSVVDDVIDIDLTVDEKSVSEYVQSLVKHAKESERHDTFSKAKLFGEEEYQILNQEGLNTLIGSTKNLISNLEFRNIIEKHVSIESLKKLYVELMLEYSKRKQLELKKEWLNQLISDAKIKLQRRTAATAITDIDLYKIALNKNKISKFSKVVRLAKTRREIENKTLQGFKVVAKSCSFEGAGDLKKLSPRRNAAFSEAYAKYNDPYAYLQELKKIDGIEEADFHKYFAKIEYKILNKDGFEVSGGERSEFNLLQEIQDAQKYDMLLIDEPESSFDNLFLKKEVNAIISDISKNMPVVIVTHNSTVGASIKPDYILCTKKEIENGKIVYRVYSGAPANKKLFSPTGESLGALDVTMDCLEAGNETYNERREAYENLKN